MFNKKTLSCSIQTNPIQYEIVIGERLVEEGIRFAKKLSPHVLIVTLDSLENLLPLHKEERLILRASESIKSRATKEKIEDALIERAWGRESCILVIGGGALLDLVGFVAATYCRGICYLSIPTTLLAMTDAALGGKTGVNVEEAKNWIGAFHHPEKIFIDLTFLKTLPDREFLYGMAETIKHSLIADDQLFEFLEGEVKYLLQRQIEPLSEMIFRSCAIKKNIVERDPYEKEGYRRILNFGHTIGHALETLSEYRCSHGQAVIMGMFIEAVIAKEMGYFSHKNFQRIENLWKRFQFKMEFPKHLPYELLKRDKKGAYRFVVLTGIGRVASCQGDYTLPLSKAYLDRAWNDVMQHHQVNRE